MKRLFFLFLLIPSFTIYCQSLDHRDLLDPRIRDILIQELDGEKAKQHVIEIAKHHRVQASQGYRDAANYVLEQLRSYGFSEKDAYIESYKSDGKTTYQTWQSPSGWDVTDADLSIVEPTQEKIVSFKDIPMSLMTYSNAGDVTAEVVWIGEGTKDEDYKDKKVKGKFVLATGNGEDVHRLAVIKYGAKAIVSYLNDTRGKENPDMIRYTGIWPRTEELPKVTFGFNISNSAGEKIKNLLQQGTKVVLRGHVIGKGLEPSTMEVVVANIHGNPAVEGELVFSAHLDHPKECANDNASGSAAILDIARTLKQLIDNRKLPLTNHSFRFLWVPEWYGTMAYIDAHPELQGPALSGKFLANINMDMVGENLELLHSKLYVVRGPYSVPSCLNDVVENMTEMVDKMNIRTPSGSRSVFNYRIIPFRGGSDHLMFLDRKIPSVMLSHSDYTHHTTFDSPDKVDPLELKRCEAIAACSMWYLANLSPAEGVDLLDLVKTNSYSVLGELVRKMHGRVNATSIQGLPMAWAECSDGITRINTYYNNVATSIIPFASSEELFSLTDQMRAHLGKRFDFLYGMAKSFVEANGYTSDYPPILNDPEDIRVPVRLTRGPVDFRLPESKLSPKDAEWYNSKEFTLTEDQRFEIVNLIDGKRNVSDIRNTFIAEYSPIPDSVIIRFINDLVKVGVVKWNK
jgi:aminopeptidase YwaD